MDVHLSKHQPMRRLLLVAILFAAHAAAAPTPRHPNPNCPTKSKCGSVEIPFPFGTTEGCALDRSFLIHCNKTSSSSSSSSNSHTPFLPLITDDDYGFFNAYNMSVLSFSLNGELRVSWPVASQCYANGTIIDSAVPDSVIVLRTPFNVSTSRNKLTAVGCDTVGASAGWDMTENRYPTGCLSFCNENDNFTANGSSSSCPTTGCCAASIPGQGLYSFAYRVTSLSNHSDMDGFNPCGHAFVVENGAYHFHPKDLDKFEKTSFPVVLDWTVGNHTCRQAMKNASSYAYACKADNSTCRTSTKGLGYLCSCSNGFRGNPYLLHGCRDINECRESNDCVKEATCTNTQGNYTCSCPKGQEGDGKKKGKGCTAKSIKKNSKTEIELIIALIVSVSIIALFGVSIYAYWGLKKRKFIKLKERFFQQNGGLLLQQKIARHQGSIETAKVYTMEELKRATNNFDEGKILGKGGQGTVYEGLLPDNRIVAIKKSKCSSSSQVEHFINEVIVLSQINHRNVVKLLGCCLETEVPLLVYEFISNGTVFEHLHDHTQSLKLTWKTRLRIAAETAGALAYLHSATSQPVIHRDVKTTNILLDHDLTAKVSDFGASRIVPLDKTQVTTLVQGTLGYLDPEYFHTSQLTEKSDVYSFGVVLAELLTGRKALSFDMPQADKNLAAFFVISMEKGHLLNIVNSHIIDEAKAEILIEFANITKQCLRLKGDERPTMKEVAMELEKLRAEEKHRWESDKSSSIFNVEDGTSVSGISFGLDSINMASMSLGGGR